MIPILINALKEKLVSIMFDLVVVGHFTIDQITIDETRFDCILGGPPTYSSLAARKLGANVSVVSKVGDDFPRLFIDFLKNSGIDLDGLGVVKSCQTTNFVLDYKGAKRVVKLVKRCEPIYPEDVPNSIKSKAVHLGPVAGELPAETISRLSEITELISLDPQGFVRSFNEEGIATLATPLKIMFEKVKIFKSSEQELKATTGTNDLIKSVARIRNAGPEIVIVTKGVHGISLFLDGMQYEIPSFKPPKIVDYTGAGDVFIGAFMAQYLKEDHPIWCAAIGSAAASFVIEGLGPSRFGESSEILERADVIYNKVKKITS
jgi:sugar/nucleoside kinase (ribokinase family)